MTQKFPSFSHDTVTSVSEMVALALAQTGESPTLLVEVSKQIQLATATVQFLQVLSKQILAAKQSPDRQKELIRQREADVTFDGFTLLQSEGYGTLFYLFSHEEDYNDDGRLIHRLGVENIVGTEYLDENADRFHVCDVVTMNQTSDIISEYVYENGGLFIALNKTYRSYNRYIVAKIDLNQCLQAENLLDVAKSLTLSPSYDKPQFD